MTLFGTNNYLGLSHASIYDACRMAEAETLRFRHNDPGNLARRLERMKDTPGIKLVIVEGLYSMLGDRAPLAEFAAVVREAGEDVHLMVDEAHSLGVLGKGGRGLCEEAGVEADVDFVVGTFSKSVGTVGGFCVSDIDGFDRLRLLSRPYMFTASMTPGTVETARAAFGLIRDRPKLRARLTENAAHLHADVKALGLGTGPQAIAERAKPRAMPVCIARCEGIEIDQPGPARLPQAGSVEEDGGHAAPPRKTCGKRARRSVRRTRERPLGQRHECVVWRHGRYERRGR